MQQRLPDGDWFQLLESATAQALQQDGLRLDHLLSGLGDKAFGLPFLILSLPCAIPFLYGVPQIVSIPILLLAVQFTLLARAPWLPQTLWGKKIASRQISVATLEGTSKFAKKWFGWTKKISRPNLFFLSSRASQPILGFFITLFGLSIAVPLPSTNTAPGIAIAIMSIGLLNRDGRLILLGILLGSLWVGLLIGAVFFSVGFLADRISGSE